MDICKFVCVSFSFHSFHLMCLLRLAVLALTVIRFVVALVASFVIITRMDEPVLHSDYSSYDYGMHSHKETYRN